MDKESIEALADLVADARLAGRPLERLSLNGRPLGEDEGYAVQTAANRRLADRLGPVAGHKIGGTTAPMRELLRVPQPVAGEVFASTVHRSGAVLARGGLRRPGIETEIAVTLAAAMTPEEAPFDRAGVAPKVASLMAAIEIVDNRYADFPETGAATFIADNAFNAASILAGPVEDWRGLALDGLAARTWIDGTLVAEGTSASLMGHPLDALAWLANRYAGLGRGLAAGSFVSLGSMTPVQWLDAGGEAEIEVEGLGRCAVSVS